MAMKKLAPDIALMLRNQHAIMINLNNLLMGLPDLNRSGVPVLVYQIDQTDEAIRLMRAKDD